MKLGKEAFNVDLPLVLVEKIKIFPSNLAAAKQRLEVTLSLQKKSGTKMMPYRVFVAFANKQSTIARFSADELSVKQFIRDSNMSLPDVRKRYLKLGLKEDFDEHASLSDNTTVVKKAVTFIEEFDLKSFNNLYIYAVAYKISPQSNKKSGVENQISTMLFGQPASETLVLGGSTPNNSTVFKLAASMRGYGNKNDIWTGPIHVYKGVYMAGPRHTEASHPSLIAVQVSNQKVQDMRFLNIAEKLSLSNFNNSSRNPQTRKNIETVKKIVNTTSSPISDAKYSRTNSGALKILFSVNRLTLAQQNTELGSLMTNNSSISSCSEIENIQVYRTRVQPSVQPNKLTPGRGVKADVVSESKLIGTLKNGVVQTLALKETTNSETLQIMVTDSSLPTAHPGSYQYKVIFNMIDRSSEVMMDISKNLIALLSKYDKYISNIDIRGQKVKDLNLKTYMKTNKTLIKSNSKDWQRLIDYYITAITFIFGGSAFGLYSSLTWRKNLLAMINPDNGDMNSILKVRDIISNFNMNIQKAAGKPVVSGDEAVFKITSKAGSQGTARKRIIFEHIFSSNYEAKSSNDEGTDYLDASITNSTSDSFTGISFANFERRITAEVQKYGSVNSSLPAVNKYGYLSPKRVRTKGNIIQTDTKSLYQEDGNGILASNLSPNVIGRPSPPALTDKVYTTEIDLLLNYSDVSVVPLKRSIGKLLETPNVKAVKANLDSTSYFSNNSPFNKDIEDEKTAISGSSELNIKTNRSRKSQILKSDIVKSIVDSLSIDFKRTPVLLPSSASAPVASLAAQDLKRDPDVVNKSSNFENTMNYNSIAEIQYFDGYRKGGGTSANKEVWKTLDKQRVEAGKSTNTPILCRTVLINKGLDMPNNYKLPEYDNLFTLGNSEVPKKSINSDGPSDLLARILTEVKTQNKKTALNINSDKGQGDVSYAASPVIRAPGPKGGKY